jgi:hypothetical protein
MTAARYDLIIDQGSDFSLELTVKESGSAKDLSKWHGRAMLRKTLESDAILLNSNSVFAVNTHLESDGSQAEANHGKVTLDLPFSSSDDIAAGTYHYDLEIYFNNSADSTVAPTQVKRLIGGIATIRREVTR